MEPTARFCLRCGHPLEARPHHSGEVRPTCPRCGWVFFADPKVAVAVLTTDDRGRVLLVQRRFPPQAGRWTLPGGFLNPGEAPRARAAREVAEETGLVVRVGALFTVVEGRDHPQGADVVLVYAARVVRGALRAGEDARAAAFFPPEALPPLAFRATRQALLRWAARRLSR